MFIDVILQRSLIGGGLFFGLMYLIVFMTADMNLTKETNVFVVISVMIPAGFFIMPGLPGQWMRDFILLLLQSKNKAIQGPYLRDREKALKWILVLGDKKCASVVESCVDEFDLAHLACDGVIRWSDPPGIWKCINLCDSPAGQRRLIKVFRSRVEPKLLEDILKKADREIYDMFREFDLSDADSRGQPETIEIDTDSSQQTLEAFARHAPADQMHTLMGVIRNLCGPIYRPVYQLTETQQDLVKLAEKRIDQTDNMLLKRQFISRNCNLIDRTYMNVFCKQLLKSKNPVNLWYALSYTSDCTIVSQACDLLVQNVETRSNPGLLQALVVLARLEDKPRMSEIESVLNNSRNRELLSQLASMLKCIHAQRFFLTGRDIVQKDGTIQTRNGHSLVSENENAHDIWTHRIRVLTPLKESVHRLLCAYKISAAKLLIPDSKYPIDDMDQDLVYSDYPHVHPIQDILKDICKSLQDAPDENVKRQVAKIQRSLS